MKIKMLKDQSWMIKKKIVSYKKDVVYEIVNDEIIYDMLRLDYGVEVQDKKVIDDYENKAIESSDIKKHKKRKNKKK